MKISLSMRGFLWYAPVSIIAVPVALAADAQFGNLQSKLILGVGLTLLTFLFYSSLMYVTKCLKISDKPFPVLAVIVSTGIFRGIAFYELISVFHFRQPSPFLSRVLNSLSNTLIALTLSLLLVESNRRFARKYQATLMQLLLTNMTIRDNEAPGFAAVARELTKITQDLRSVHDAAIMDPSSASAMQRASEDLRRQVDEAIRPLSHRLWIDSIYDMPKVGVRDLLRRTLSELDYPFARTLIIYSTASILNFSATLTIYQSLLKVCAAVTVFGLLEFLRKVCIRKYSTIPKFINSLFLLLVGTLVTYVSINVGNTEEATQILPTIIIFAPWVAALIYIQSTLKLGISDRKEILRYLYEAAEVTKVKNRENATLQGAQIASYLHNSLQSEITKISAELSAIAVEPNLERNKKVLQQLNALIVRSISQEFRTVPETPNERFSRILDSWNEIIKLDVVVDEAIFRDEARSSLFVQITEEAIANSVRKGGATELEIHGTFDVSGITILIKDNGHLVESYQSGLGMQWLESVALSEVILASSDCGTSLKLSI